MRIAIIADMHGNFVALETVAEEIEAEGIERIICLGDVGSAGPQPHEVIEWLREHQIETVLGNTDAWLLDPPPAASGDGEGARVLREINAWCAAQLTAEDRAWIAALPPRIAAPLDEGRSLLCYHGSPNSYDDVIAAATPDEKVAAMLGEYAASVMVGGHTHVQMIRRYRDSFLVNVGSAGLSGLRNGSPNLPSNGAVCWAEYGVIAVERGRLSIELRRTPLPMPEVRAAARASGMPYGDWWQQRWSDFPRS